jgi:hypothetical protein
VSDRIELVYRYRRYDDEGRFDPTWAIDVVDKDTYQAYTAHNHYQARAVQIAIVAYQLNPPDKNDGRVPIDIAQSGSTAIAVYLYGGVMMNAEDVCETMDITLDTLTKYVRRVEKRLTD